MRWRIRALCLWRGVDWRRSSLAWLGYGPVEVDIVVNMYHCQVMLMFFVVEILAEGALPR